MNSEHVSETPLPPGGAPTTGITTPENISLPDPKKTFPIERALLARDGNGEPVAWARSAGFREDWVGEAHAMVLAFGTRPVGIACPRAVFARPFELDQVCVVEVADQPDGFLAFHFLVMDAALYAKFLGDPFWLAAKLPAVWSARGPLSTLHWPKQPMPQRTIDEVRAVLKRLKPQEASEQIKKDTTELERTTENSESPALLGGVQALVEGSRLVFERSKPDPHLIEGLWTLLPTATRGTLWAATFAFSNYLGFDAVVVPRAEGIEYEGYVREQQAIEYPEGHYELNLQIAVEAGKQEELDALFARHSLRQVWILVCVLLVSAALITLMMPFLGKGQP